MEPDAALRRAAGGVVMHAPAGEHLDSPVVHAHGHRHLQDAPRRPQEMVDVRIDPGELCRVVEPLEDGGPWVVDHDPMVPYSDASVTLSAFSDAAGADSSWS